MMDLESLSEEISRTGLVRVASIADAVRFASHMKQTGRYDLFRGQRDADWGLSSSAERKGTDEAAVEEVRSAFTRLHAFAKDTAELTPYLGDRDALWAIAQHYGLPTLYIDFTKNPSVAAFFAADSDEPPREGQEAAIFCFNSSEFNSFWKGGAGAELVRHQCGAHAEAPEIIDIDVTNLFRLQAQEGCFLWMPIPEFERLWSFDRIVFPYTKNHPCLPSRELIYPHNQSALEQLLTRFFMNERLREGTENVRRAFGGKAMWKKLQLPHGYYDGSEWLVDPIPRGRGWEAIEAWVDLQDEQYHDTVPGWVLHLDGEALEAAAASVVGLFRSTELGEMRGGGIEFETIAPVTGDVRRFLASTRRLWNGMRRLPYTRDEIVTSLEVMARLFASTYYRERHSGKSPNSYRPFNDEEAFYVGFGPAMNGKGPYSRAHVSRTAVSTAFSEAFIRAALQRIPSWDAPDRYADFIQLPCRPWHRFTFEGLKDLMVHQLIPSQLVWRNTGEGDDVLSVWIAFSPAELKTFGLA